MARIKALPDVSIHAPVKGANIMTDSQFNPYAVSIHAPVKGAN